MFFDSYIGHDEFASINHVLREYDDMKVIYSSCFKLNTESKNLRVAKTKDAEPILLWNCVVRGTKKLRFTKEQEASVF